MKKYISAAHLCTKLSDDKDKPVSSWFDARAIDGIELKIGKLQPQYEGYKEKKYNYKNAKKPSA